jgi:tetratricopeptide (TPR) repeat protein
MAADFHRAGWPGKARRFARRALSIFGRELGTDPGDVVRALLCLASAREGLEDYTRAEADYRRANDLLDRLAEPSHTCDVQTLRVQAMRGLASVMLVLGDDREAEVMLRCALAMAQQSVELKPSAIAAVLDDLGVLCRHAVRHEEASLLHHMALAITEEVRGPEHPQAATILHHLGLLEQARGRCAAGEGFARRAVAIRKKTLGPDHPQVAAALTALAALLEGQQEHVEATLLDRRARTILENAGSVRATTALWAPRATSPGPPRRPRGPDDSELLTGDDVICYLVDRPWLRKAALTCVLPAVSVNGEWRFHRRDLNRWITRQEGVAAS